MSIVSDEQSVMVETYGAPGLVSRPQHPHQTRQRVSETKQRPVRESCLLTTALGSGLKEGT